MFATIITRGSRRPPRSLATPEAMLAALQPYAKADVTGLFETDRALIVQALWHNTPESLHETAPQVCPETGRVIAAWVRLDNRSELCAALKIDEGPTLTDPQIILAAHRLWGEDCANRLEGDFSFVIYDPAADRVFAARDSIGAMPLSYFHDDGVLIVATAIASLQAILRARLTPSLRWIARYLVMIEEDPSETQFNEILHLPRAHHMTMRSGVLGPPVEYFSFQGIEAEPASEPEERWLDAYKSAFDRAVARRLRSYRPIGMEISGGLDSGAIAAYAMPHLADRRADVHGFGMAVYEFDSKAMVDTAMHLRIPHLHALTSPLIQLDETANSTAPAVLGIEPRGDSQGYYDFMLGLARHYDIRTILSGYGGDEIVTAMFPATAYAEAVQERNLRKLYAMSSGDGPVRLFRTVKNLVCGLRHLRRTRLPSGRHRFLPNYLLSEQAADAYGITDLFESEARAQAAAATFNEGCLTRIKVTRMLSGRLERMARKANEFGIEFRYPMFDRQLMVQVLRTPTVNLLANGVQRSLHRAAIADRLPDSVLRVLKNQVGPRRVPPHWTVLAELGVQTPDIPSAVVELIDDKKLHEFKTKLSLPPAEMDRLPTAAKAALTIQYYRLKMLDYWLQGR